MYATSLCIIYENISNWCKYYDIYKSDVRVAFYTYIRHKKEADSEIEQLKTAQWHNIVFGADAFKTTNNNTDQ